MRILPAACALLLLPMSNACRRAETANDAPGKAPDAAPVELTVKAARPRVQDWTVTVPISGSIRSKSVVEVRTEVGGRLRAAHFEEGALVRRGQVLAEIDPVNYRLAYDQAMAALAVAQAARERAAVLLDHAGREKERADNLLRTGGITEKDHQAAVTGVREAESQLRLADAQSAQAKASVAVAEKSLRDCRILAGADGRVQKKFFDPGSLLAPGSPVYTIVDNSRLELESLVPSYQLAQIRTGLPVLFTTPTFGERAFRGNVSSINPMVELDNRSVRVVVGVANPNGELRAGMYARGSIEVKTEPGAVVVPRSALVSEQQESGGGAVFVVEGGKALRRPVKVGGTLQDRLWIREGLGGEEIVVVEVGPNLKDGSAVKVANGTLE